MMSDHGDEEHLQGKICESLENQRLAEFRLRRDEQDRAYEEALALDQVKAMIKAEEEEKDRREQRGRAAREVEEERLRGERREAASEALEEMRMCLNCEPESLSEGCANVVVRLPSGKRLCARRFAGDERVQAVYDWVNFKLAEMALESGDSPVSYDVSTNMPRRKLSDRAQTLEAADVKGQVLLVLETHAANASSR